MFRADISHVALLLIVVGVLPAATHEIYPDHHSRVFSAHERPVLRIHSGDTVITKTWDSGGQDHTGLRHLQHPYVYPESGNPLMGPFYIEGAERGDALEVHLDKLRLNRNWGYTAYRLNPEVLTASAAEGQYKNFYKMGALRPQRADLIPWDLDLEKQTASPRLLEGSGFQFKIPVRPMLGCIGVAVPGDEVLTSGPAGSHGGNMDYNDVAEGATLFFPIYHQGAYFYVGDGHALQGDGEGLGSGVETSLDVQFTVKVHKNKRLGIPRLVNGEYLVSIGSQPEFRSSMDFALRAANADMLSWLTTEYKLTAPEANMLLGTVVQHKIATYFGTVATLIPRKYLQQR
jgi:acetamidase/formamidase